MIILYGISNCDTIKKARTWLQDNSLEFQFHDYKKLGCDPKLGKSFLERFGLETTINKRGTSWRKLPEHVKQGLSVDSALELMAENPSMIKRPILKAGDSWLIGFNIEEWTDTLL